MKHDGRWLAADGDGVFRYEVLPDKIQYPTTLVAGDVALITDTHGISALVNAARREGVSLVVGCGDSIGKMKAAFAPGAERHRRVVSRATGSQVRFWATTRPAS